MDIALFLPEFISIGEPSKATLEWLRMVHGIPDVQERLKSLKRKSLLESLGDGIETCIGMHDLWRGFCRVETDAGRLSRRQWVYETYTDKCNELVESSPSNSCWENVKRMAFVDCELRVSTSALIHLTSLEVIGNKSAETSSSRIAKVLTFMCLISNLWDDLDESDSSQTFIMGLKEHWESRCNSRELMKQIGCLEKLQYLILFKYGGGKLLDMRSMASMRCIFCDCKNVVTVTGLSSKLAKYLRILDFDGLQKLRSCHGVGDLVALEQLSFTGCRRLKRLPNLQKLGNLRKLDIRQCPLIVEVPGLGDLVALEELYAGKAVESISDKASYSLRLPDIRKPRKLRVLFLTGCRLGAVPGLDSLTSLQKLEADFRDVVDKPSLRRFTKLEKLVIEGWTSEVLRDLDKLVMLHTLNIHYCCGVDELPRLQSLIRLQQLWIVECEFKDVSSLSTLGALQGLFLYRCTKLESAPDLRRLTRLENLLIHSCPIEDLTIIGNQLPRLMTLELPYGRSLSRLTISGQFYELSKLELGHCSSLTILPHLYNFPGLTKLDLCGCVKLTTLRCSGPLKALQLLNLGDCNNLNALPDLGMFPVLEELVLEGCGGLTTLRSTAYHLPALKVLYARRCRNLNWGHLREFNKCIVVKFKLIMKHVMWTSRRPGLVGQLG